MNVHTHKFIFRLFSIIMLLVMRYGAIEASDWRVAMDKHHRTTVVNGAMKTMIDSKGRVKSCTVDGTELVAPGCTWYFSYNANGYHELEPSEAYVKVQNDSLIEIVYAQEPSKGIRWTQGYVFLKAQQGIYTYLIAEGGELAEGLGEARFVYRLDDDYLNYYYIDDAHQGEMPRHALMASIEDRVVQDATFYMPDSSIYTKYNYCDYLDNDHFHGILSDSIGVWAMSISREYVSGGPLKQDILLHSTSKSTLLLQMLHSGHFGTAAPVYKPGMQKIYGPFYLYVNKGERRVALVEDARREAQRQEATWPFAWFRNELYPIDRSSVCGKLKVEGGSATKYQVILADSGNVYNQGTGYIYWAETDAEGRFTMKNVRPGEYVLHAYALGGENTEEWVSGKFSVVSGQYSDLGTIEWKPKRNGRLVWMLGESDRKTDGFGGWNLPRDYSNAKRSPLHLDYTTGKNKPADWYYVQLVESEWNIHFDCRVEPGQRVVLTAPVAGASYFPVIEVLVNGRLVTTWDQWETWSDPAVYRSATRSGYYQHLQCVFPSLLLRNGTNTITFRIPSLQRPGYGGVLWDCIKLEIE